MTEDEKTVLLAEGLMGWHKGHTGKYPAWMDENEWPQHPRDFDFLDAWRPFQRIEHAKMVQAAMVARGYSWHAEQEALGVWVAFADKDDAWGVDAEADAEARAICEAAGRALGLWKGEG